MNQRVTRGLLEKLGFRVEIAPDGEQALAMLRRSQYCLIVMDCQMPNLDGYEATQVIRREKLAACPIIAVTAHAMVGDREACLAAGMDDYLTKPLSVEALRDKISRWVKPCDV